MTTKALTRLATLISEEDAIEIVTALADVHGYGNLIHRLKEGWSKKLQEEHGMDKGTADRGGLLICPWCDVDCRTGKKAK